MKHITADLIAEQSATTGVGPFTLTGALVGHRRFNVEMSIGQTCHYSIQAVDAQGVPTGQFETGRGTYSGANTLTRTTVVTSSSGNALVDFAAGAKIVRLSVLAPSTPQLQADWAEALGIAKDLRKLAPWFQGGLDGKECDWLGDSTTWQQDPATIIRIGGGMGMLQDWHVPLRATKQYNWGENGQTMQAFVMSGGSLATAAARKRDMYVICYGLNDFRVAGPGLGLYGTPSNIESALTFQGYMRTAVAAIRAQRSDAVIIFRMPNSATEDSFYVTGGTDPQAMMDVLRLAYRGDPALGVPSPETFGEHILVFDSMGMAMPERELISVNPLLQNFQGGDGLHPGNTGYSQMMWPLGLLMSGPAASTITSAEQSRQLAAREQAISKGWQTDRAALDAVLYSGEYYPVYTGAIGLKDASFVDVYIGPVAGAGRDATGSDASGSVQQVRPAGLALDDVVVFGTGENATAFRVKHIGTYFLIHSSIRFSGTFMDGKPLPTALDGEFVIYRHRYAHSTAMRKNEIERTGDTPVARNEAFANAIRFCVVDASVGSITVRAIANERGAQSDMDITQHNWSTSDRLCLAGVEAGSSGSFDFGLSLDDATFVKSGFQVTVNKPGIDFTNRLGDQGFVLSGAAGAEGEGLVSLFNQARQ